MNYSAKDIKKLGTILGIWAHPDDETWWTAGVMAQAVHNGQRVAVISITFGDAGESADQIRWPKAKLGQIRKKELQNALKTIGITEHYTLGLNDGTLKRIDPQPAIDRISQIIATVQPATIFTFAPDGLTGHTDHSTVNAWTLRAAKQAGSNGHIYYPTELIERYSHFTSKFDERFGLYFNIKKPACIANDAADLFFELDHALLDKKLQALKAQECQTAAMFADKTARDYVKNICACEAFVRA